MRTNVRVQLELKSEVRPRSIGDFCVQRVRRAPGATTHIYPTLSESNRFAANAWRNARIPTHLLPWAERFFRWRRG